MYFYIVLFVPPFLELVTPCVILFFLNVFFIELVLHQRDVYTIRVYECLDFLIVYLIKNIFNLSKTNILSFMDG